MSVAPPVTFNLLEPPKQHYGVLRNFIGGKWVDVETDRFVDVDDPASGKVIAQVPISTRNQVNDAIQAARDGYDTWRRTPPGDRGRFMFEIRAAMQRHAEELSRLITQENGKVIAEGRGEAMRTIEAVETSAAVTSLMGGHHLEDGAARNIDEMVVRQPLGVCACITPFNFPIMMTGFWWPYAIAAGNTFVVNQSKQTPITITRVFEIIEEVGLPAGVMNLVQGDRTASAAFMDSPLIKAVGFIGSTPVAKEIYRRAGETGKRCVANGGAKNFAVFMPDADVDRNMGNLITSFFGCTGQRCLATAVVLAVGDIYDELVEKFAAATRALRVGPGLDESVHIGPVISAAANARIRDYIQSGIDQGAELLVDGRDVVVPGYEGGHYVGPTIFDNCTPDMTICQDEIFGPVAAIVRVKDLDEALAITNASPYGNQAVIYTTNGGHARRFWYEVEAGNIGVNIGVAAPVAYFPFAGMKDSHYGNGYAMRDSFDLFTEKKVVITRW
jgi:malonate-semialdehyde dehydrogenase (acetylating)/methylmalonate-semialdehyde dehydrogenase